MFVQINDIDWENTAVIASVFMTIIMMLLTYSISLGIAFGFITYIISTIAQGKYKQLNPLIGFLFVVFLIYLFFGL